jgi:phospholipid/cholesterol/gamma-HCH transport system permease protein
MSMIETIAMADPGERRASVPLDQLEAIGASVQRGLENVGAALRFALEVGRAGTDVKTWWPELLTQMRLLGVASLPITAFIALFTGIVLALLASYPETRSPSRLI